MVIKKREIIMFTQTNEEILKKYLEGLFVQFPVELSDAIMDPDLAPYRFHFRRVKKAMILLIFQKIYNFPICLIR